MKFFFDNCIAPAHARAIQALIEQDNHLAQHLKEKFDPATPDIKWLGRLADEGKWVIISGDIRITRNEHEKAKWLESGLTAFFLARGWQNLKFWDQAAKLVQRWPDIMQQAERVESGAGFIVKPTSTKFEQVRIK